MPEHRLHSTTPLGGTTPRVDELPGFRIAENIGVALASIASRLNRQAEFATAAKRFFGFEMPAPGKVSGKAPYTAVWTGVDQWFVEAPFTSHENIAQIVKDGFGDNASVTEQTDGWACFDVGGPAAPAVFERLCALDVHAMAGGAASRTTIEHIGCIVICREARLQFSILGPRSSAASLHHALMAAARSVA
ncbi:MULTISPECIES: sarcosine oxidase subunit gamma [unclassified Mesorhizobium]|uniref:sarcosine oxidase subunit gamma n=1 Tax=unclassified Mesorhizobium TaxID=325217 RepID=UPI000BAEA767|nr:MULTISPECIES: sarcosine oxidase subunit gamma [unclassified Mesorhizobium]TGT63355.1 sarcosine oxidase subunit gamma [Mesorhizobium sp. M00.F.Ca.ET.170.01.1.1]AZO11554.1 sarcosine oxidase subunit gamma [Mesorhizobium sp. M3A.F.Ca.ET.080.04.2.1]PBB88183.1 sarcosine oxidase subunit gamma [Mesorhizobium sp. WSM3876]RWB67268.1 MAG: sarcosine oxidase subunit gamma [Mesorhizobium sp.]RWB91945.1 MAG: sarcosine oxidase subunit gamma [Mesorhizobium sp.]